MKQEDFVTFKQAIILKKIGFDWECMKGYAHYPGESVKTFDAQEENINGQYNKWCCSAPTLTQTAKWMREERGIDIVISPRFDSNSGERIGYFWRWSQRTDVNMNPKTHKSYESALSDAISTILKPFENYE